MAGLVEPVLRLVDQVAAHRADPVAPGAVLALDLLPEAVHTAPVAVRPAPLEAPHTVVAPAAVLVVLVVVPLLAVALETGFGPAAVPLQVLLSLECIAL